MGKSTPLEEPEVKNWVPLEVGGTKGTPFWGRSWWVGKNG